MQDNMFKNIKNPIRFRMGKKTWLENNKKPELFIEFYNENSSIYQSYSKIELIKILKVYKEKMESIIKTME